MSNLVLGSIIGTIGGGAEVSEIPVNFTSPSGTGTYHVVDVPIPAGVTARVMVVGTSESTMGQNESSWPSLIIGGQEIVSYYNSVGGSTTVTGPTVIEVGRKSILSTSDPSFVGTVYWWEEVIGNE